eukprot:6202409-Pleurochrysis_carterae.AAC.1
MSTGGQLLWTCVTQSLGATDSIEKRGVSERPIAAAAKRRVASTSTSSAKPTSSVELLQRWLA